MAKIIFDTSILIDCLRGNTGAVSVVECVAKREIDGFISVLTEAELSLVVLSRLSVGSL